MNERIENIRRALPEGVDALMVCDEVSRQYFTGFHSTAGVLVITREESCFFIDFRYIIAARSAVEPQGIRVVEQKRLFLQLKEMFERCQVKKVALQSGYTLISDWQQYQKALAPAEIVFLPQLDREVLSLRAVKDQTEVDCIRKAQQITDRAFEEILSFIRPGRTEQEVAVQLEHLTRLYGSEGNSFDFIVVAGENSAKPHGVPSGYVIQPGDLVTMDFGCKYGGYCSDMTRTVAVGHAGEEERRVYETVLRAQLESEKAVREGIPCSEVDAVARRLIADAGYAGAFGHALGHSVGLEIHEQPVFAPGCGEKTRSGMVITLEPGVYLDGKFGVRIEDMIVVQPDGCLNLTHSPKDFIIL